MCTGCGTVYHLSFKPTSKDGVCDKCGGRVEQRNDDKEAVIDVRLKTYKENTEPLRGYYKDLGKYVEVNGSRSTESVFASIKEVLKDLK